MPLITNLTFTATKSSGKVSAILMRPQDARWLLVLGHGAGVGMRHAFMQALSQSLAEHGIATFRYQFPFIEQGKRFPSPLPILMKTVRSAVAAATAHAKGLMLLAGGKSLGGRMTSNTAAIEPLPGVSGLVFFGFPLHAPGKPSVERAEHLKQVTVPMLFLQGTRDKLAGLDLLKPVCDQLGPRSTLHIVEGADHGFHVLKKSGRTDQQALDELAKSVARWSATLAR